MVSTVGGCGETGIFIRYQGCKMMQLLWKEPAGAFQCLAQMTLGPCSSPRFTLKRTGNTRLCTNLYTNVHSSIIHNSQKMETTQVPVS